MGALAPPPGEPDHSARKILLFFDRARLGPTSVNSLPAVQNRFAGSLNVTPAGTASPLEAVAHQANCLFSVEQSAPRAKEAAISSGIFASLEMVIAEFGGPN